MRCVLPAVILLFVLSPACVLAQTPEWPPVGELIGLGDYPGHVAVQDGLGYFTSFTSGENVVVVDVSEPASPSLMAVWPLGGDDITVFGELAYVRDYGGYGWIVDISDPVEPRFMSYFEAHDVRATAASDGYLYLVAGEAGLRIIDVSDPANPTEVGSFTASSWFSGIALDDGLAYVTCADEDGLRVIDVSDPANPTEVEFFPTEELLRAPTVGGPGLCLASMLQGAWPEPGYGLVFIDVSQPTSSAQLSVLDTPGSVCDIAVSGFYAYVADQTGTAVVEFADPVHPTMVGSLPTGETSYELAASEGYVYVLDSADWGDAGRPFVVVADISDPSDPCEVARWRGGQVYEVAVSEGVALLARDDGLALIDVTDPQNAVEVAYGPSPCAEACDLALADGYAYAACGWDGLAIMEVTGATIPAVVGELHTGDYAGDVALSGDYVYVTDSWSGLCAVDVTSPTAPILAGRWDGAYSSGRLAVSGEYAYLANSDSGLWILGLSDPAEPTPLSYLGTPGGAYDVAVAGGRAYVAADEWGLLVVDVSDPLEPAAAGFLDTPGYARAVAVLGTTAYVTDHRGNLFLVDITDPDEPQEVAHWESPGDGLWDGRADLALDGGYVYLELGSWGLRIFPARATFGDVGNDYWAFEHVEACVGSGIVDGYPDGLYHCEVAVTRDQMAVYISRALAGGDANVPAAGPDPTFSDVPEDHWAHRYVEYAAQHQVVEGYLDGEYKPNLELDRGQMAVYIARSAAGSDDAVPSPTGAASFEDVPDTFWSYRHVEYCVAEGVVAGYEDGLYHPELTVTRDQMAVYVSRAFGLL